MFIKINDKNKVIMQIADRLSAKMVVDNVKTFKTQNPPLVKSGNILFFDPIAKVFYTEKVEITEAQKEQEKAISEALRKKDSALKWLSDNDWKINKRMIGEWAEDDERWLAYLADRAKKRTDIDDADAVINGYRAGEGTA